MAPALFNHKPSPGFIPLLYFHGPEGAPHMGTHYKDIRQPLYFSPANKYYPARYSIWKDDSNNRHYISLDELVLR
jgi:hypothetical protein